MAKKTNSGGPAFPVIAGNNVYSKGISMRDYFACEALKGCDLSEYDVQWIEQHGAVNAYRIADAMLAAREAS